MEYQEKLSSALRLIDGVLASAKNPAIMCSFGKDSMVVLDMVMKRRRLKVIFHREPLQHHKYEFANRIIRDMDLHVIDYPPLGTTIREENGETEIVNHYQIGGSYVYLPTGLRPQSHGRTICALEDIYNKPTGTFNYPFDVAFHGHKSSDVDPVLGAVPLKVDMSLNPISASAAFPIRHFTDEDVWRYIEENNVPVHHERYEKVDGQWREREDKTHNPDYINACYACMTKAATKTGADCPRFGCRVSGVYEQLRINQPPKMEYLNR